MQRFVNPFTKTGNWYKANLHVHTTTSDGRATPEEAVALYREQGYDVLALTDHHTTNDVRALAIQKILLVSGIEFHPPLPGRPCHLVGLNVPHGFKFADVKDANRCIAEVEAAGGLTILAHPFWCGLEYEDFHHLEGLAAIEVWNTTCDGIGRACSDNEWAYALDRGLRLPAVAVDDAHWKRRGALGDAFRGWTWLKMPSPTVRNVLKAIRTGACYPSCGPKIHDFRITGGKVLLRCSPAARICFMAGPSQGARRVAADGRSIRAFSCELPTSWAFVRAVVTNAKGSSAWTNPIFLAAK